MMKIVLGFIFFIALVLYGAWVFGTSAQAHEWFTDKRNPGTNENCCNSVDCRVIGNDDWWMEGGRIFVKWSDGRIYSMPGCPSVADRGSRGQARRMRARRPAPLRLRSARLLTTMPTERLDCPVCGAMFLRSVKASKTCSHQLVKRQPRLAKYAKPKPSAHDRAKAIGAEIRAAMARRRGMP